MHRKIFNFSLILFLFFSSFVIAQQNYTLQAAIDTALIKNLGIQISRNYAEMSSNDYSPGNAGMLPSVDANGSSNFANNHLKQETSAGTITDKSNVATKTYNGNIALSWTIFDGARMFATYKKLGVLEQLGELQVKKEIVSLITSVSLSYFDVVRLQTLLSKTNSSLVYYDERKRLADTKLALGNAAKTELLQATVDYNTELSDIEQQKYGLAAAKVRLNELLMRNADDSITAIDTVLITEGLEYGTLISQIESGNLDLHEQLLLQEIADQELKETKAGYYPELNFNAGYNFNKNSTTQGFFLENQNYGPNAGFSLRWNLFNGMVLRNQVKNAKIANENAALNLELIHRDALSSLASSWQYYQGALSIVKQQTESEKMAKENLDITMKRYRLNESNVLDLREAQRSLDDVQGRLSNAIYVANVAATQLKQLTGLLLK